MPGLTITKLKEYFSQYAKPTAAQFGVLIDTLYEKAASILPQDNNSFNLGSATKKWKDIYSSGEAFLSKITATGLSTLASVKATVFYNAALIIVAPEVGNKIDLRSGNVFKLTVDQDLDIRFVNLNVGQYKLILIQDANGGHKITLTGAMLVGQVGTTAKQIDILDVVCDGVDCYVNVINNYK